MFVDSLGSCESLCCSLGGRGGDAVFTPSSKSPESQYHDRKRGQNAASASCYFKGEGNRSLLEPTMGHIFSQWGSLMCEQGSGRAVNRAFYEAARGELGLSMEGTKPRTPCGHARPGLVCFDGSTGLAWLRALFTLDMYQAAEPALHERTQLRVASEPPQVGSIWAHWFILLGPAGYWGAGDAVCHMRGFYM